MNLFSRTKSKKFNINELAFLLKKVEGQISDKELFTLYSSSMDLPPNSTIVEIGSYKGKSTVALGLGAKLSQSRVYAIDPHEYYTGVAGGIFGPNDLKDEIKVINKFDLGAVVFPICLSSNEVGKIWTKKIELLWIDGDHTHEAVYNDFSLFSKHVTSGCFIIFHDSSMEGVASVISKIDKTHFSEHAKVDSMTIFKKI